MSSEISDLVLAVHLFDNINSHYSQQDPSESLTTIYNPHYTKENEKLMTKRYIDTLVNKAGDTAYCILVARSDIHKGYVHKNLLPIIHAISDHFTGRYAHAEYSVDQYKVERLTKMIGPETRITAIGEKSSGCVLWEVLNLHHLLGCEISFEKALACVEPENGVDSNNGYPRLWQKLSADQHLIRVDNYICEARKTYDSFNRIGE